MLHTQDTLLPELTRLKISYELFEHPAVFTVEEAQKHCGHIPGVHCKNLFLKDKKDAMWLVTVPEDKRVDLKALEDKIGSKRLSFGSAERLMEYLGVPAGSVTPLAVINDAQKAVRPVLDKWMLDQPLLNFHPLINTATVTMTPKDLLRFMEFTEHKPQIADV